MKKAFLTVFTLCLLVLNGFAQAPCTITSTSATICAGEGATLNASGGAVFVWSTGDSATSISVAPQTTTSYTVTNTVSGCSATSTVIVNALPTVSTNDKTICNGDAVTLKATGAKTYTWSHGGTAANDNTVKPKFKTKYTVTGTDTNGCVNSASSTVDVFEQPKADFEISPYLPNIYSDSINFTDLSTGTISNRTWNFGDDDTTGQNETNPVRVYPKIQTNYNIILIVSIANGCADTAWQELVIGPLTPSFIYSYDKVTDTYTLNVDPNINSNAESFEWNFGDGTTSTLDAPTHTFIKDSVYTVCMKIYTTDGDSAQYCQQIGKERIAGTGTAGFSTDVSHLVSIEEQSNAASTVSVSPNPTSGMVTVHLENDDSSCIIKLSTITGIFLFKHTEQKGNLISVDLSAYPAGTYILEVIQSGVISTSKLIKE